MSQTRTSSGPTGLEEGLDKSVEATTFFVFPFVFAPASAGEGTAKLEHLREAKDTLVEVLTQKTGPTNTARWQAPSSDEPYIDRADHLGEREYLHPFARDALRDQTYLTLESVPWSDIIPTKGWEATFTQQQKEKQKDGSEQIITRTVQGLTLVQAAMHLFDIGVGLLTLEVEAKGLPLGDLLFFNERFRHTGQSYPDEYLSQSIVLSKSQDDTDSGGSAYLIFDPEKQTKDAPVLRQNGPDAFTANALVAMLMGDRFKAALDDDQAEVTVEPILDRRMVTFVWAALPDMVHTPRLDDLWRRLLYVDGDGDYDVSHEGTPAFVEALDREHHYERWWSRTVRIGFSRYSLAMMGDEAVTFYREYVRPHFCTLYYTMGILLLVQRAKLIQLSEASSRVARRLMDHIPDTVLAEELSCLKAMFLLFGTRYYFSEMTHQDQGIDMSRQWADIMDNPRLFAELGQEIERFEAYQSQRAADKTNWSVNLLTIVLTVAALWTGLLGANFLPEFVRQIHRTDAPDPGTFWVITGISLVVGFAVAAIWHAHSAYHDDDDP